MLQVERIRITFLKMLKLPRCQSIKAPLHVGTLRRATTISKSERSSKPAGDISSVFPSLSGAVSAPLPPRFADLKRRLIHGHEDQLRDSWQRLLAKLREETEIITALGSKVVPELNFEDLDNVEKRTTFRNELHNRGVAVIRGVVAEREALDWKELTKRYIQNNPATKGKAHFFLLLLTNSFTQYWMAMIFASRTTPFYSSSHALRPNSLLRSSVYYACLS